MAETKKKTEDKPKEEGLFARAYRIMQDPNKSTGFDNPKNDEALCAAGNEAACARIKAKKDASNSDSNVSESDRKRREDVKRRIEGAGSKQLS
jgi:hypothetical protein